MPEQDQMGTVPAHEAMADMLAGTQPRKVGLFGRLMGQKHQQNLREDENKAKFILENLHAAFTGKTEMDDQTVDWLISQAGSILGKETGMAIKQHAEQVRAAKKLQQFQAETSPQQTGQAPPAMSPQQQPNSSTGPTAGGGIPMPKPPGMPQPPFEGGAPAGPAPAQPNPVELRGASAAKGGIGFGGPPPDAPAAPGMPPPSTGGAWLKGPVQSGVDLAAIERPVLEMRGQAEVTQDQRKYDALKARYQNEPWFRELSDVQKAQVLSGGNVTASPHYNIPGQVKSEEGDLDYLGNPVPIGTLGNRRVENGQLIFQAAVGVTKDLVEQDAASPTGWSRIVRDRTGGELSRRPSAPPPAYAPTTTTNSRNGEQVVTVGNEVRVIPTSGSTTTTTQRNVPGMPPPPAGTVPRAGTPPAAPARPPAAAPPSGPRQGRVLGASPAAWAKTIENEYTPNGQKVMSELYPRKEMIGRLLEALKPYKDSDVPASSLIDMVMYRLGIAGDRGAFLSQLQLGSIAQAASLIKGASRAQQVLGQAMIHTPNAWKDSSKMMYEKLTAIQKNMQDMEAGVNKFERKYPGLSAPPAAASGMTPPPGNETPPPGNETEAEKIERLARKHQ